MLQALWLLCIDTVTFYLIGRYVYKVGRLFLYGVTVDGSVHGYKKQVIKSVAAYAPKYSFKDQHGKIRNGVATYGGKKSDQKVIPVVYLPYDSSVSDTKGNVNLFFPLLWLAFAALVARATIPTIIKAGAPLLWLLILLAAALFFFIIVRKHNQPKSNKTKKDD